MCRIGGACVPDPDYTPPADPDPPVPEGEPVSDEINCSFNHCPAGIQFAVVWFGANRQVTVACDSGVFHTTRQELCAWGVPAFKYNGYDGTNDWSRGNLIEVSCDHEFDTRPDPDLGTAGVTIVGFTDISCF